MRFDYARYRREGGADITRPIIEVILRNPKSTAPAIAYEALVDSGSDRNIFPASLAELLDIDLTSAKTVLHVGGVVDAERRPVYLHPIEIEVGGLGGPAVHTMVGFMPDFSRSGHGLLGRKGFFDAFSFVKFKDFENVLEIGKIRR